MSMPELKPCPFCGVDLHKLDGYDEYYHTDMPLCVLSGMCFCEDKGIFATLWNRRVEE